MPPFLAGYDTVNSHYIYDKARKLQEIARPDGNSVTLTYNEISGKLETVNLSTRGDIVLNYHETGAKELESITTPEGNMLNYLYDGGFLISETMSGEVEGSVAFDYDNYFRVSKLVVGTDEIDFTYNGDGQLITAGDISFSYDSNNGFLSESSFYSLINSSTYTSFGELNTFSSELDGNQLFFYDLDFDKAGRIVKRIETLDGETHEFSYEYDSHGRLDKVFKDTEKISDYKYDENGNRLTANDSSLALLAIYDDQDRLLYEPRSDTTYLYSANGDLETKTDSEGTTSYSYDEFGNLISVTLPDSAVIDYIIDGKNRRIAKKIDGVVTYRFIYQDRLNPVAKVDEDGNIIEQYVYATKFSIPDYMIRDGEKYSIISDYLGSPRLVVKVSDGSIMQKISYNEFGVVKDEFTAPGFDKIPFGYAGGIDDKHTGLIRFGARDYGPETGRWTAKEPLGFRATTNFYAYVDNDPINNIDITGLDNGLTYAETYIDFFGNIKTEYFSAYYAKSKLIRNGIDIHEAVHRKQFAPYAKYGTIGYYYALQKYKPRWELEAYSKELEYLNDKLCKAKKNSKDWFEIRAMINEIEDNIFDIKQEMKK